LYAASLTNDLKTKTSIYEAVIKLFPDDYRAYNDLSCVKASQGEMEEAQKLLEKASSLSPNNGVILNNTGVIALMNKDYEAAKTAFEAAQKAGASVSYNMGVLDMKNGDYAGASSKMSGAKCAYNLALQQLLSKNYTAAKSTLDCIQNKGGEEHYLAAVVAARMNSANEVYSNLKQACEANAAYKVQAKKDMEFKAFRTKPEFDAAIK
jgi:tetratricopeptide (TPR) repeat protein